MRSYTHLCWMSARGRRLAKCAKLKQTVWKVGLSGFRRSVGTSPRRPVFWGWSNQILCPSGELELCEIISDL
jgi:hypothetical protein